MKNPKNIITLILVLFISILMFVSNNDNTRVYGEWHFDQSVGKFLQNINKEDSNYYLNNMNFNYGSYPVQDIIFFNNYSCDTAEVVVDTLIIGSLEEVEATLSEVSDKIKVQKMTFTKVNDEAILFTTTKKESVKNTAKKIVEEKKAIEVNESVQSIINDTEVVVEDPVIEEKEEIKVELKKKAPVKPLFKDFNNSTDYQKALRKYYKEIE